MTITERHHRKVGQIQLGTQGSLGRLPQAVIAVQVDTPGGGHLLLPTIVVLLVQRRIVEVHNGAIGVVVRGYGADLDLASGGIAIQLGHTLHKLPLQVGIESLVPDRQVSLEEEPKLTLGSRTNHHDQGIVGTQAATILGHQEILLGTNVATLGNAIELLVLGVELQPMAWAQFQVIPGLQSQSQLVVVGIVEGIRWYFVDQQLAQAGIHAIHLVARHGRHILGHVLRGLHLGQILLAGSDQLAGYGFDTQLRLHQITQSLGIQTLDNIIQFLLRTLAGGQSLIEVDKGGAVGIMGRLTDFPHHHRRVAGVI